MRRRGWVALGAIAVLVAALAFLSRRHEQVETAANSAAAPEPARPVAEGRPGDPASFDGPEAPARETTAEPVTELAASAPTRRLRGRVVDAEDAKGIEGAKIRAIPDAAHGLLAASTPTSYPTSLGTSGSSGEFEVSLPEWSDAVRVTASGYWRGEIFVTRDAEGTFAFLTIALSRASGAEVAGIVVDSARRPVAGAMVSAKLRITDLGRARALSGYSAPTSRSDASGRFRLSGLPAETGLQLTATSVPPRPEDLANAARSVDDGIAGAIVLANGESREGVVLTVVRSATLTVTIRDAAGGESPPAAMVFVDKALANRTVESRDPWGGRDWMRHSVRVAPGATGTLRDLDPGEHDVVAAAERGTQATRRVRLEEGETLAVEFVLRASGRWVTLRVLDETGAPLDLQKRGSVIPPAIEIRAVRASGQPVHLRRNPWREYANRAEFDAGDATSVLLACDDIVLREVPLVAGVSDYEIRIDRREILATGSLRLRLLDANGLPLLGSYELYLIPRWFMGGIDRPVRNPDTDFGATRDGVVVAEAVREGRYLLWAARGSQASRFLDLEIRRGEETDLGDVHLRELAAIELITQVDGPDPPRGTFEVRRADGLPAWGRRVLFDVQSPLDVSGRTRIDGVPLGECVVLVRPNAFVPARVRVTVTPGTNAIVVPLLKGAAVRIRIVPDAGGPQWIEWACLSDAESEPVLEDRASAYASSGLIEETLRLEPGAWRVRLRRGDQEREFPFRVEATGETVVECRI